MEDKVSKTTKKDAPKDFRHGHRQRLKDRFMKAGLEGFATHEILEMLLFYTIPQRDTKPIAHELIQRFGSIDGVFSADPKELMETKYITENSVLLFKFIPRLMEHYHDGQITGTIVDTIEKIKEMFIPYFNGLTKERLMMACFDNSMKLIKVVQISEGDVISTEIDMRKIVSQALSTNCLNVVIAHNHIGGSAKPSDEDILATDQINRSLEEIKVRLIDHVIVCGEKACSMRDFGFYQKFK